MKTKVNHVRLPKERIPKPKTNNRAKVTLKSKGPSTHDEQGRLTQYGREQLSRAGAGVLIKRFPKLFKKTEGLHRTLAEIEDEMFQLQAFVGMLIAE